MSDRGYVVGPTLAEGETPWPLGWERDPKVDDGHLHEWECVLVRMPGRRLEECVRCVTCHAPRCGSSRDDDPCMQRRHHTVDHVTTSGKRSKVGA